MGAANPYVLRERTIGYRYVDRGATETASPPTARLRRERQSGFVHGVFPGRPGPLPAMFGEVGFGASWEAVFPGRFEASPGLFEA
jgi:hypothetical protein